MRKKLTGKEMEAAALLHRKMPTTQVSETLSIDRSTLYRLRKTPEFKEYMESLAGAFKLELASQVKEAAKGEVARMPIIWDRIESARRKLAIADDKKARNSDKLVAIRALDEMHGVLKDQPSIDDTSAPAAPDVYVSEWNRKPQ